MGVYGSPDLSNQQEEKPLKLKKPFYKRWWFIALVIIVIIGIIGSGGEEKDTPKKVDVESTQTTLNTEEETTEIEGSKQEFFYMGDVVETSKVKAIITGAERSEGSDFNKPADGHEFIIVNMTIENISDEEINVSSLLSFDAYVDDVVLNENFGAMMEAGQTMDGTIAPGKKLVGSLGYEVPKDWKTLEIHFEPDVWDDVKIKWIINNE